MINDVEDIKYNLNSMSMHSDQVNELLESVYTSDRKSFDDFVSSKKKKIDFSSVKRLVLSELALNKSVTPQRICGFTRKQIINMSKYPERYGQSILKLMDYMYQSSGYMKRLIDYFSKLFLYNIPHKTT